MRMPFLSAVVLAVIFGPNCLWAACSEPGPAAGQRVFVTAHSFHIFVAHRLTPLAKGAGILDHELVGKQMIGGSRVRQHWDLPDRLNPAKRALVVGDVDVLTMSPNWLFQTTASRCSRIWDSSTFRTCGCWCRCRGWRLTTGSRLAIRRSGIRPRRSITTVNATPVV